MGRGRKGKAGRSAGRGSPRQEEELESIDPKLFRRGSASSTTLAYQYGYKKGQERIRVGDNYYRKATTMTTNTEDMGPFKSWTYEQEGNSRNFLIVNE